LPTIWSYISTREKEKKERKRKKEEEGGYVQEIENDAEKRGEAKTW
jgi:hypothetical protein